MDFTRTRGGISLTPLRTGAIMLCYPCGGLNEDKKFSLAKLGCIIYGAKHLLIIIQEKIVVTGYK